MFDTDSLSNAPRQQRSRELTLRILEGALKVLGDGESKFTIRAVAQASSVSIGGICGRFGNRQQLIYAVHDHVLNQFESRAREALTSETKTLRIFLRDFIEAAAITFKEHGEILVKLQEEPGRGPVIQRVAASFEELLGLVESMILRAADEVVVPDPFLSARIVLQMILGALGREATLTYSKLLADDLPAICEELEAACFAYLIISATPRRIVRPAKQARCGDPTGLPEGSRLHRSRR